MTSSRSARDARQALLAIAEDIRSNGPAIVKRWERLASESPWLVLPERERLDHLPTVIHGLVEAALTAPPTLAAVNHMLEAAAEHGRTRRHQTLPDSALLQEYYALRAVIWDHLSDGCHMPDDRTAAIMRLDVSISSVTTASLLGYHEMEFKGAGVLEAKLAQMAEQFPLLAVPDGD